MRKHLFFQLVVTLLISTASIQLFAQNTSPYWSLAGNSNASTSSKLGTTNSIPLRLLTNNTVRIYVSPSAGYVGVGTTAPTERLHINSASGKNILRGQVNGSTKLLSHSNGGLTVGSGSTPPSNGLYVVGNVGIGTATPSYKLHVEGGTATAIYANSPNNTGVWGNSSSGYGINGTTSSGYGVVGSANTGIGVYGGGATGVYGSGSSYGLYGSGGTYGVWCTSSSGYGIVGKSNTGQGGNFSSTSGYGLVGISSSSVGIVGQSTDGQGANIASTNNFGLVSNSTASTAVVGNSVNSTGGNFYSSTGYGIVAGTGASSKNWAAVFNGNTYAYGTYQASDQKLKKNVENVPDALTLISKLKPHRYEFSNEGNLAALHLPQGKHYGLIAQELEQVLPDLVKEVTIGNDVAKATMPGGASAPQTQNKENMAVKSVNYIELIPIIVKGMQEQTEIIKQQQVQINDLKDQISRLSGNNILTSAGTLGQNTPNPVRTTTRISYSVPSTSRAQLLLTDALGKTVKVVSLNNSGYVNLNAAGFSSGMYNYSLMVDGKIVESKKMEVVR